MEAIHLEGAPAPKVPLSPGVRAGDFVYVSGQTATRPDGRILIGDFQAEANGAIDAVEAVVQAAGGTLDDVVKVNAYLSSGITFGEFNEVYAGRFSGAVKPARTTVVVAFGHPDVRVEIEAIAYLPQA